MTSLQLYEAARRGDLEAVRTLHRQGGEIVMAMMGGADGLAEEQKDKSGHKACIEYAWQEGAPVLFSIQQPKQALTTRANPFFTRVHMVGGIGEVPAGTFKTKRSGDEK